jgi:hypothetical protein
VHHTIHLPGFNARAVSPHATGTRPSSALARSAGNRGLRFARADTRRAASPWRGQATRLGRRHVWGMTSRCGRWGGCRQVRKGCATPTSSGCQQQQQAARCATAPRRGQPQRRARRRAPDTPSCPHTPGPRAQLHEASCGCQRALQPPQPMPIQAGAPTRHSLAAATHLTTAYRIPVLKAQPKNAPYHASGAHAWRIGAQGPGAQHCSGGQVHCMMAP